MDTNQPALTRQNLLELHKHYAEEVHKQLGFCFSYLNFYIGLFSAVLGATLTGGARV